MPEDYPKNQDDVFEQHNPQALQEFGESQSEGLAPMDDEMSAQAQFVDPDEGRIKDKELAVDVAYAGKPDRDRALSHRKKAEEIRNVLRGVSEHTSSDEPLDADEKATSKSELKSRIDALDLSDFQNERLQSLVDRKDYLAGTDLEDKVVDDAKFWFEHAAAGYEGDAEDHEERADRLEYWTEILGTHPLSEAFLTQHRVSAEYLTSLEEELRDTEEYIAEYEEHLEVLEEWPMVAATGKGRELPSLQEITRQAYRGEPDEKEIFASTDEAIKDPNTTLGKICEMYRKAYRKARIEPHQKNRRELQSILEDVRSGRASDPDYTK
jgi:hypothetical protein